MRISTGNMFPDRWRRRLSLLYCSIHQFFNEARWSLERGESVEERRKCWRGWFKARRHYVYDTNQRACDKSIVELTQCMAKRILLRFDVESAIAALRGEPQLSNEQRLQIWNKLKVIAGFIWSYFYVMFICLIAYICVLFHSPPPPTSPIPTSQPLNNYCSSGFQVK